MATSEDEYSHPPTSPGDERRFTGAVSLGSTGGTSIVLATQYQDVLLTTPATSAGKVDETYRLSSEEAWCLAQQLLLACRRVGR